MYIFLIYFNTCYSKLIKHRINEKWVLLVELHTFSFFSSFFKKLIQIFIQYP